MDQLDIGATAPPSISKTVAERLEKRGWRVTGKEGEFAKVPKYDLGLDDTYQRPASITKVQALAADWSWMAFGSLTVVKRPDGKLFVADGQHRTRGAYLREDINTLPCMVFEVEDIKEEADIFLQSNANRKPVTAIHKFKAQIVADDATSLEVKRLAEEAGRIVADFTGSNSLRCVTAMRTLIQDNHEVLLRIWPLTCQLCQGEILHEKIVRGLFYIEKRMPEGASLTQRRYQERLLRAGYQGCLSAIAKAAAFRGMGGARVWAEGLMTIVNYKVRNPLVLRGGVAETEE